MMFLPPTTDDLEVARIVNQRLPAGAHVDFYRVDMGKDEPQRYGVVFQYHSARKPVEQEYPFFDADSVVTRMRAWMRGLRYG